MDGLTREVATFERMISEKVDELLQCLEGLDAAGLNWRPPAPQTNSLYVLATHTLANAQQNILGVLCGQADERDRTAEFAVAGSTASALIEQWQALRARLAAALRALPVERLAEDCLHRWRGPIPGREVLLVVARHTAEHAGQATLTRDLLRATLSHDA